MSEEEPREAVSSVEVYGFVGWITSAVAYVLYLLWAFTPARYLEAYGISYYPSQYWAVALPAWACVTVVAAYWAYEGLNLMAAPTQQELAARACASAAAADCSGAFFSRDAAAGALPLVDLPEPVVRMVLQEGRTPHGAPRWCLPNPRANAGEANA